MFLLQAFSKFVSNIPSSNTTDKAQEWVCCEQHFKALRELHRHVGAIHGEDIKELIADILIQNTQPIENDETDSIDARLPKTFDDTDVYSWLPAKLVNCDEEEKGKVVLFYRYRYWQGSRYILLHVEWYFIKLDASS